MKKFKMELRQIEGAELLLREQLKSILGGQKLALDPTCPDGQFVCTCTNGSGSSTCCASSVEECWSAC